MAISQLVSVGYKKDRNTPSLSAKFHTEQNKPNVAEKVSSDMFSGGKLVDNVGSMLQKINEQLKNIQESSQKTIDAFNRVIKDMRDVKKDIVSKFRVVNKEIDSNKQDFINSIRNNEPPKPLEMPEPGAPVPANAPAAPAVTPAAGGGGFDIMSALSDLLGGASVIKDIIKWIPAIASSPIAGVFLGATAAFAAFAGAMFSIASVADWIEDKLGLKELYKKRMESDEYKDMQKVQADISDDARRKNVDKGESQKLIEKTLKDNKIDSKNVKSLQGDILSTLDGTQYDIMTQKPAVQGPPMPSAAGGPSANAPAVSAPAPGGVGEGEQPKEQTGGAGGGGGSGGGGASPAPAATAPAAPGGAPSAAPESASSGAPAAAPSPAAAPPAAAPAAPAAPAAAPAGAGSAPAPSGTPARAPAAETSTPPTPPSTPTPVARPTGEELKALGGAERANTEQQQAQSNVAAIQNPMAAMAAKMEEAKKAEETAPKPVQPNTIVKGQEPVYTAMGDLAIPGTPDQKFVGSGRGSVREEAGARALAQEVGSGRGSGEAELAQRRKDAAKPSPAPAAAPAAPTVDPHSKSKAMFQQVLDMEAKGDSGATAMYFAADKQRQAELESLKNPPPGAPAPAKKGAPKQKEMSAMDKMRMGRGAGDHKAPVGLGDESAGYTGAAGDILQAGLDQQAALNAGPEPGYSGKGGQVLQKNLDEAAAIQEEERKQAAKMYDVDDMGDSTAERAKLEEMLTAREKVAAGASPAQAGMRASPQAMGAAVSASANALEDQRARDATAKMYDIDDADMVNATAERQQLQKTLSINEAVQNASSDAEARSLSLGDVGNRFAGRGRVSAPNLEPPPKNAGGASTEPTVINNNQSQNIGKTSGGEGNNTAGQNLPMTATNSWLSKFFNMGNKKYQ